MNKDFRVSIAINPVLAALCLAILCVAIPLSHVPVAQAAPPRRTGQMDPYCPVPRPASIKSFSPEVCGVKLEAADLVTLHHLDQAANYAYELALSAGSSDPLQAEKDIRAKVAKLPPHLRIIGQGMIQAKMLALDHRTALRIAASGPEGSGPIGRAFWEKAVKLQGESQTNENFDLIRADLRTLQGAGAAAGRGAPPTLVRFDFARLKTDTHLRGAFQRIFPESAGRIDSLSSPNRSEVVRLGDQVILPYARFMKRHPGEESPKVVEADEYEHKAQAGLKAFQDSVKTMMEASKQGGSWSESWNKFVSYYGGTTEDEFMSPELVQSEKAHDSAIRAMTYLRDRWGIPREGVNAMIAELSTSVVRGNANREAVITSIGKKFAAVALTPALYSVSSLGWISGFATGMGIGGAMMLGNAATSAKKTGGSLLCNLGHEFNRSGANTFLMSLAFAPLGGLKALAMKGAVGEMSALRIKWGLATWAAKSTYSNVAGTVAAWNESKRLKALGYPPKIIAAMEEQAAKGVITTIPDAIRFGQALRTRFAATKTIEALNVTITALKTPGSSLRTLGTKLSALSAANSKLAESWRQIAEVRKRGGDPTWKNAEQQAKRAEADSDTHASQALSAQARAKAKTLNGLSETDQVLQVDKIGNGVRLTEFRDAEGRTRLMLSRSVGSGKNAKTVSNEVLVDTVSGGINLNSPGGQRLAAEIAEIHAGKNNAAVVVLDVNNLSKINSSGGHDAGDRVLKEIFKSIRGIIEKKDLVTRSGGDEFTIILRDVTPAQAKVIQERMVKAVDANPDLRSIFRVDKAAMAAELRGLNTQIQALPVGSAERTALQGRFDTRKAAFDLELRNRPGITPGSSMIGAGDSFKTAYSRADQQSVKVKQDLYTLMHWKTEKYPIQPVGKPDLMAKAKVADPVPGAAKPLTHGPGSQAAKPPVKLPPPSETGITRTEKIREGIKITEFRDAEGTPRMMLDRTIGAGANKKIITEEVLLDTVSGGINLNSPGAQKLASEVASLHAGKNNAAVVVIDVNNLSKINSSGGHDAGDRVLQEIFKSVRAVLNPKDLVTRSGGDEFTIILRDVTPAQAKSIQQRMVDAVHSNPELRTLFRSDRGAIAQELRTLHQQIQALPAGSTARSEVQEKFNTRKKAFDLELRNRPGITPGSSMIGSSDSFKSAYSRADQQSVKVKQDLYTRMHWKTEKYPIQPVGKPELTAKPLVLEPIPGE